MNKKTKTNTKRNQQKKTVKKVTAKKNPINWKLIKKIILSVLVLGLTALAVWNSWINAKPVLNVISIQDRYLPAAFDGYRIAHISDFHSAERMTDEVICLLENAKPDIICITGDLIDSRDKSPNVALRFVEKAMKIAPCYFVAGNHEMKVSASLRDALFAGMADRGVILLEKEILVRGDSEIALFGNLLGDAKADEIMPNFDGYKILLSHYPEDMDYFLTAKYDLVLAGHAHGGQFRLPFVGGLYAPGQGIFPKYDAGLYSEGKTDMVVSRGIGNSTIPLRFHNRPEVVLVELHCN